MGFWKRWKRRRIIEREQRVHRLKEAVISTILANVGESVLHRTIATMQRNKRRRGHCDYTSLGKIWVAAQRRCERDNPGLRERASC